MTSVNNLSNSKYEVAASSSADDPTRGILVVIRRSLNINITDTGNDTEGRIAFIKAVISNMKIVFVNAYAPANYDKK